MQISNRAVRRLALRLAPATITQWGRLVEADHSGRPPLPASNPGAEIVALAEQLSVSTGRPTPILQGRHLIAMGMTPGPELGATLERAYHAQIDGAFDNVDDGLAWVARHAANTTDWRADIHYRHIPKCAHPTGAPNSLFTQQLLAGLRGGIDSEDGLIHIFEIFEYIQPRITAAQQNQHPIFKGEIEENFPVALYVGGRKGVVPKSKDGYKYDVYVSYTS